MFRKQHDDMDDFKKKREQYSINIRRNNRQQIFNKRRNIVQHDSSSVQSRGIDNVVDLRIVNQVKQLHNEQFSQEHFNDYVTMLQSPDYLTKVKGVIGLRSIIDLDAIQSDGNNRIITQILKKGLTPKLINFITLNQQPQLKHEAVWLVSNISYARNACAELIKFNIVQSIIKILQQNQIFTVDHAIVCVGNISAQNTKYRDLFLTAGALQSFYKLLGSVKRRSTYENCLWAITNLCRGSPAPNYGLIDSVIPVLCKEITNKIFAQLDKLQTIKVLSDILWTFSFLVEGSKARADRLIQNNTVPMIIKCVMHENSNIYMPSLRIVGSLASLGQKQTQVLLNNHILDLALKLLSHSKKQIRRQTCWILSNIAAGTTQQVNKLMSRVDIMGKINQLFQTDELDVKHQICWIYPNLGYLGDKKKVVQQYMHYDIMKIYVQLMDQKSVMLLESVLKCMYKVFLISNKALIDGNNIMLMNFMEYGGAQKLDKLQQHQSNKIYKAAVAILTKFFQVQESKN